MFLSEFQETSTVSLPDGIHLIITAPTQTGYGALVGCTIRGVSFKFHSDRKSTVLIFNIFSFRNVTVSTATAITKRRKTLVLHFRWVFLMQVQDYNDLNFRWCIYSLNNIDVAALEVPIGLVQKYNLIVFAECRVSPNRSDLCQTKKIKYNIIKS